MPRIKSEAFDLKDSAFKGQWRNREEFALWLCNELDLALAGRRAAMQEVRYCWDYYEQQRMRSESAPWPDAADLPSPYAPEYTDAIQARLMQTIFVEPVWTVEGWGQSAKRAPFVEEFHQRAQEDERLQLFADEWILRGLVEGVGTLEISEAYETRRETERKRVALQVDPTTSQPVYSDEGPLLARDPDTGDYLEPQSEAEPFAEADVEVEQPVRLGPDYDVIPYSDFLTLPAHARNRKQVWGYAKRFWRRVPQLEADAKRGIYDLAAVKAIGADNERGVLSEEGPAGPTPVSQESDATAQKELFEVQLLADLDGKGERWWRATVHKDRRHLLRLRHDDRTTRYIRWMPFPKPGNMDRGYSLIGHKLITVLEEDTARRNLTADRMAVVAGQPMKRLHTALWEPSEQPFGPRSVIDVRDMDEVQPMQGIQDVPASVMAWRQHIRDDADRLIGQNDVAQGQISEEKRTLGEVQLVAGYAEVRTNLIIKRLQEPLEELGLARHNIWKRTLASNANLPMRRAFVIGKQAQGVEAGGVASDQRVTADLLEGIFWFKPRGSVETADLNRQRQDTVGLLNILPALMQMNPAIGMIFQTMPAAKALVEQVLRVYRWPDTQSFLGSEADNVFDRLQQQQQIQQDPRMQLLMAVAGAAPGMGGGMLPAGAGAPTGAEAEAGGEAMPPQGAGVQ